MFGIANTSVKVSDELEAEVQCKVGHTRWVDWDFRHSANTLKGENYHRACCPTCMVGTDQTKYTGRKRWKTKV